jgi:hypothetical protein
MKYPELDIIVNELVNETCCMINQKICYIESKMPYKAQYILEELIKKLQERV